MSRVPDDWCAEENSPSSRYRDHKVVAYTVPASCRAAEMPTSIPLESAEAGVNGNECSNNFCERVDSLGMIRRGKNGQSEQPTTASRWCRCIDNIVVLKTLRVPGALLLLWSASAILLAARNLDPISNFYSSGMTRRFIVTITSEQENHDGRGGISFLASSLPAKASKAGVAMPPQRIEPKRRKQNFGGLVFRTADFNFSSGRVVSENDDEVYAKMRLRMLTDLDNSITSQDVDRHVSRLLGV